MPLSLVASLRSRKSEPKSDPVAYTPKVSTALSVMVPELQEVIHAVSECPVLANDAGVTYDTVLVVVTVVVMDVLVTVTVLVGAAELRQLHADEAQGPVGYADQAAGLGVGYAALRFFLLATESGFAQEVMETITAGMVVVVVAVVLSLVRKLLNKMRKSNGDIRS